jgi:hypothetical protein
MSASFSESTFSLTAESKENVAPHVSISVPTAIIVIVVFRSDGIVEDNLSRNLLCLHGLDDRMSELHVWLESKPEVVV